MFDFHAHPGSDNSDSFISILREREIRSITPFSSIGLLPWMDENIDKERIEKLIREDKNLMVGEFGLDKIKGDIKRDWGDFLFMAELAKDYDRFAVIHAVRAVQQVLKVLRERGIKKAIFHSYTGSYEMAREIEKCGYLISLGPSSFRSRDIEKLLSLDFLIESDMETGEEQKNVIAKLYEISYEKTGKDIQEIMNGFRRMIWPGNSSV